MKPRRVFERKVRGVDRVTFVFDDGQTITVHGGAKGVIRELDRAEGRIPQIANIEGIRRAAQRNRLIDTQKQIWELHGRS